MNKVISVPLEIFGALLAILLLLTFLPLIILIVVASSLLDAYGNIWKRLRHDPRQNIDIEGVEDETWQEADTKEQFIASFESLCTTIADLAKAKQSKTTYKGFEVFENLSEASKWTPLALEKTLHTEHAKLKIKLEFGLYKDESRTFVGLEDEEERCDAELPILEVEVVSSSSGLRPSFETYTINEIWLAVGFLTGGVKLSASNQLWVYVSKYNVWLVQYSPRHQTYGLRSTFNKKKAHRYRLDEK